LVLYRCLLVLCRSLLLVLCLLVVLLLHRPLLVWLLGRLPVNRLLCLLSLLWRLVLLLWRLLVPLHRLLLRLLWRPLLSLCLFGSTVGVVLSHDGSPRSRDATSKVAQQGSTKGARDCHSTRKTGRPARVSGPGRTASASRARRGARLRR
jgi:hypothetical protein